VLSLEGITWEVAETVGQTTFRLGFRGDYVIAEWGACAWLVATRDGQKLSFETDGTVDDFTRRKLEAGSCAALLRRLARKLTVHGASAEREGRALLVLGESGQGKSTAIASLCARHGHRLVADDLTWVDVDPSSREATVVPSEAAHFLTRSSCEALGLTVLDGHDFWDDETKCGVGATPAPAPAKLVAVVTLGFVEGPPRLVALDKLEALTLVLPQVARFGVEDRASRRAELEALAALLETTRAVRLERPRDLGSLDDSVDLLATLTRASP
jgi:hypothetical protein